MFPSAGASIVQQDIAAGLLDELRLHQAPVLLGAGVRLGDGSAPPGWNSLPCESKPATG
ncbi:dihydrofolate reductase family protein [Micromonospora arida]|uniref:dihydrofolate reductase family protein n=1 Tax=Micromonospora arida TaxID=2203715 RepID=UPI0036A71D5A